MKKVTEEQDLLEIAIKDMRSNYSLPTILFALSKYETNKGWLTDGMIVRNAAKKLLAQ